MWVRKKMLVEDMTLLIYSKQKGTRIIAAVEELTAEFTTSLCGNLLFFKCIKESLKDLISKQ